ncbi:hypothetical protein V6N00_13330 [Tersicoccus sp. MR15.9]|uniref:hypothetical protein n=1 Tax=Tersicoccus mangrovi TaxID=3121635 RepID=UPI002FE5CB72
MTTMGTHTQPHRPAGVPGAGQFDTVPHSEADVSLTPTVVPRRAELDGWPESLPEPELSLDAGSGPRAAMEVRFGSSAFEVWEPSGSDDPGTDAGNDFEDGAFGVDYTDLQAAVAWARGKHRQLQCDLQTELSKTAELAAPRLLAKLTGKAPAMDDDDVLLHAADLERAADRMREEAELSDLSYVARTILTEHPTAATAVFTPVLGTRRHPHSQAEIRDTDGNHLAVAGDDGAIPLYYLSSFRHDPTAAQPYWYRFGSRAADGDHLDLKTAATWNPGA